MPEEENFLKLWDKQIDKMYGELERHIKIFNYDKDTEIVQKLASEYVQIAIKNLFIMNGGALVILPPLIAATKVNISGEVLCSVYSFALGLFFIIITSLFSYWSCINAAYRLNAEKFSCYQTFFLKHLEKNISKETKEDSERERETNNEQAKKYGRRATHFEIVAIVFGMISLASFLYGIYNLCGAVSP